MCAERPLHLDEDLPRHKGHLGVKMRGHAKIAVAHQPKSGAQLDPRHVMRRVRARPILGPPKVIVAG